MVAADDHDDEAVDIISEDADDAACTQSVVSILQAVKTEGFFFGQARISIKKAFVILQVSYLTKKRSYPLFVIATM